MQLHADPSRRSIIAGNINGFVDVPVDDSVGPAPAIPTGDLALGASYHAGTVSGIPYTQSPAWTLTHWSDFDAVQPEGTVFAAGSPYAGVATASDLGNMKLTAYPYGYLDSTGRGHYDPASYSTVNSTLRLHVRTTPDGIIHVGTLRPMFSAAPSYGGAEFGERVSLCWRADRLPKYKVAWLLWPDATSPPWPALGEIDFPEQGELIETSHITAFTHFPNPAGGQFIDATLDTVIGTGWHRETIEWLPNADGVSSDIRYIHDGNVIGHRVGVNVPNTRMHLLLQTETCLDARPIDPSTEGYVDLAWLLRYKLT